MGEYRFKFEKGCKKYQCPACHKKRFVGYIDNVTDEYLPIIYGKCDREMKCGYHLNPYKNGYAKNNTIKNEFTYINKKPKAKPKQVYFSKEVFYQTRRGFEKNVFIQNLLNNIAFPFELPDVEKVIAQYHLGTIIKGYRFGATTFPFIDIENNVRAIQVKQFNESNHTTGTDFLHSIITRHYKYKKQQIPNWLVGYNKNETKVSCLFGEHLLNKYPHNPIVLVEAPKTAIYGTLYFGFPNNSSNLLWLAVYNLSSLNLNKCKALKGRKVYLFPDLSKGAKAYNLWSTKAQQIQLQLENSFFKVSDLLEQLASGQDREQGKDIADYLIKLNWRDLRKEPIQQPKPQRIKVKTESFKKLKEEMIVNESEAITKIPEIKKDNKVEWITINQVEQSLNWDKEIKELEVFFSKVALPKDNIFLNKATKITNVTQFVKSHLLMIKANNGNMIYQPYLKRLIFLKDIL